ncbi:MAG: tRNA (adenosine(37)-N6)-threonylcarbamoyltransferase complex ATPase subunit type 1 TsaE [Planctomycetota bacterium]
MLPTWQLENLTIDRLAALADRLISFHEAHLGQSEPDSGRSPNASLVIGLCGALGVGKTTFTQYLGKRMGVAASEVISPTFVLLRSHRGNRCHLHHLDAYRVQDDDEWWETGIDECFDDPGTVTVVEWADRFPNSMPRDTLWLRLRDQPTGSPETENGAGSELRSMSVHASTPMLSDWIQAAWTLDAQQEVPRS